MQTMAPHTIIGLALRVLLSVIKADIYPLWTGCCISSMESCPVIWVMHQVFGQILVRQCGYSWLRSGPVWDRAPIRPLYVVTIWLQAYIILATQCKLIFDSSWIVTHISGRARTMLNYDLCLSSYNNRIWQNWVTHGPLACLLRPPFI